MPEGLEATRKALGNGWGGGIASVTQRSLETRVPDRPWWLDLVETVPRPGHSSGLCPVGRGLAVPVFMAMTVASKRSQLHPSVQPLPAARALTLRRPLVGTGSSPSPECQEPPLRRQSWSRQAWAECLGGVQGGRGQAGPSHGTQGAPCPPVLRLPSRVDRMSRLKKQS